MIETLDFGEFDAIVESSISELNSDLSFIEASYEFNSYVEDGDNKQKGFINKLKAFFKTILENINNFIDSIVKRVQKSIEERKIKKKIKDLREKLKKNPRMTVKCVNVKKQIDLLDTTSASLIAEIRRYKHKFDSIGYLSIRDALKLERITDQISDDHNAKLEKIMNTEEDVLVKDLLEIYRKELESVHSGIGKHVEIYEKMIKNSLSEVDNIVNARREADYDDYQGNNKLKAILSRVWSFIKRNMVTIITVTLGVVCTVAAITSFVITSVPGSAVGAAGVGAATLTKAVTAISSTKSMATDIKSAADNGPKITKL